jgi:hypothetical protein
MIFTKFYDLALTNQRRSSDILKMTLVNSNPRIIRFEMAVEAAAANVPAELPVKKSRLRGAAKGFLLIFSAIFLTTAYGVGLFIVQKYFVKEEKVDPSKPDPKFVPKEDHSKFRKPLEKYQGPAYFEGDPDKIASIVANLYPITSAKLLDLVKNMTPDTWKRDLLTKFYTTPEITSELNYINTYTILYADQYKLQRIQDFEHEPDHHHFSFLEHGCPLAQDFTRKPNPSDALHTMMWSLRVQQHMDKIYETDGSITTQRLGSLSMALIDCSDRWKRAILEATDEPENHYMQEVYKWLTTPLTNWLYEMATSPVSLVRDSEGRTSFYYQTPSSSRPSTSGSNVYTVLSKGSKGSFYENDKARKATLSFLKICKGDDEKFCYQGPVWYKLAMTRFLNVLDIVLGGKDFRYTWWMEHLLQVLPYSMVGPWAEDYFIANWNEFTGTQALNWAYWAVGNKNTQVYDIAIRNMHLREDPPASPIHTPIAKVGTNSMPQICRQEEISSSSKIFECPAQRFFGGKPKSPDEAPQGTGNPADSFKMGINDPAIYAMKNFKCFTYFLEDPASRFDAPIKVKYIQKEKIVKDTKEGGEVAVELEAGIDVKGLLKGYLTDFMKCFASNNVGIFTEVKEGVVDIRSRKNPYFIELFAVLIVKFFQIDSRPPVYFSEELNNLIMSVDPPSAEECIRYAHAHFKDVNLIKGGKPDPNINYTWEPSIPNIFEQSAASMKSFHRTMFGYKTAGLDFDCGASIPIIDDDIVEYNKRLLIHFEWYIKSLRQHFKYILQYHLTTSGMAFCNPAWMMAQSSPPAPDLPGLLASLVAVDQKCFDNLLVDPEGNMINHFDALKRVLTESPELYPTFLTFVTNVNSAPPSGFYQGYIKVSCDDVENMLPMSHTCFNKLDIHRCNTYKEYKAQILTSLKYSNDTNYADHVDATGFNRA